MSEARQEILRMLQEGKVTADQAMDLLKALDSAGTSQEVEEEEPDLLVGEVIHPPEPPDMARFRRFWQLPFLIAASVLIVSGLGLRSLYRASEGSITFWFVCVWSIFILALVLTLLAFLSRRATWVHVRVKERRGKRVAVSLPLPLGIVGWALDFARGFVGEEERMRLDMAAGFVAAARDNLKTPGADPLVVNIDDPDGHQVQVFIG